MIRRARLLALVAAFCAAASPAFAGLRFTPVAGPPDALVISSAAISMHQGLGSETLNGIFAAPGRGMFVLNSTKCVAAPCADAQIVDALGPFIFSAWTSCGLFTVSLGGPTFVAKPVAGLPAGSRVTAMANGFVGTSNAGVYYFGSSFSDVGFGNVITPSSDGLPVNAPVRTLGFAVGGTYVSLSGGGLFHRAASWEDASNGLPAGSVVNAVGGSSTTFAAVDGQGIWRRMEHGNWQPDSNGANSAVV